MEPRITAAIERGVMQFVTERAEEGRPVGGLRVTPFDIYVHPVDGRDTGFIIAAYSGMKQAFEAHEKVMDSE